MGNCSNLCAVSDPKQALPKVNMEEIDIAVKPSVSPSAEPPPKQQSEKNDYIELQIEKRDDLHVQDKKTGFSKQLSKLDQDPSSSIQKKEEPLGGIKEAPSSGDASGSGSASQSIHNNKLINSTIGVFERKTLPPITLENNAVYSGEWKNGMRDGHGVQTWPDGSRYEGQWIEDKANGKGKLIHADGDIYEGDWVNDKANGEGTYMHANGAKYVGHWKDDKQNGRGVESWPDGAKYDGEYKEGKKHGKGTLHFADGSWYQGSFDCNDIHGYGVYMWPDDRRYEGDWLRNKMHGEGKKDGLFTLDNILILFKYIYFHISD